MLLRRYSSFLHISLVLTWNMILFEAKYHFKKAMFIGTIFLWNVFLFWVIWFTYSSDKMSTLDTIVKIMTRTSCWGTVKGKLLNIYIKNCHMIVHYMITCFGTTFATFTEIESLQVPTTLYGRLLWRIYRRRKGKKRLPFRVSLTFIYNNNFIVIKHI